MIKKLNLFIYSLIVFCFVFDIKVNASNFTMKKDIVQDCYYKVEDGNNYLPFYNSYIDNELVYYLSNKLDFSNNTFNTSEDLINVSGLVSEQINNIKLYINYGYSKHSNKTQNYILATQELIWEEVYKKDFKFYDNNSLSYKEINLDKEKEKIKTAVKTHFIKPDFEDFPRLTQIGQTVELIDKNNVLDEYGISTGGMQISKSGNIFRFKQDDIGNYNIIFKRYILSKNNSKIYYNNNLKLITPGIVDNLYHIIKTNVVGSTVTINEIDNKSRLTTINNEYGIYQVYDINDILITTIKQNDKGSITSDYLFDVGHYYIKQLEPSYGYKKNVEKIDFEIKLDSINPKINIIQTRLLKDVVIETVDDEKKKISKQMKYTLYDQNKNYIDSYFSDKNGTLKLNLPYSDYILIQETIIDNYNLPKEFKFTISNKTKDNTIFNIINEKKKFKLNVVKKDVETNKIIVDPFSVFKIKNKDNNKYICVKDINLKEVCEFKFNEEGNFTSRFYLNLGSYVIEEIKTNAIYKLSNAVYINKENILLDVINNQNFVNISLYSNIIKHNNILKDKETSTKINSSNIKKQYINKKNQDYNMVKNKEVTIESVPVPNTSININYYFLVLLIILIYLIKVLCDKKKYKKEF